MGTKFHINSPKLLLSTLEKVNNGFDKESVEYAAVELSAKCALFIYMEGHAEAFNKYLENFHAELTDEQISAIEEYKQRGEEGFEAD